MDAKDLIPIIVSILSLLIAAYTLYMQHRQKHEIVRVKASMGFLASPGDLSETMILLEAANVGERPVILSSYALRLPDKKLLIFPFRPQHVQLPHELLAGRSCTMAMPIKEVVRQLQANGNIGTSKVIPQFSTQAGRVFKGKPLKVKNLLQWAGDA